MTADEARKLTAGAEHDDSQAAEAWAKNWFREIEKAARQGRRFCRESELPALRMPVSNAAKAAALDLLRKAGFGVEIVMTGPTEFDNQASW